MTSLKIAIVVILILGTLNSSSFGSGSGSGSAHWCYAQECGPSHWPGICKQGKAQSPINLLREPKARRPWEVNMTADYCKPHDKFDIRNNGHSVEIHFKDQDHPELHKLSGEGFPDDYVFTQVHLHWGPTNVTGSEHAILGERHAMEMHLVHLKYDQKKKKLYDDMAKDGYSVIGLLFQESEFFMDNVFLTPIIEVLHLVNGTNPQKLVTVNTVIDFVGLLPIFGMVYRYNGSLTTPPCSERVLWTVVSYPAKVSTRQMDIFRSLRMENGQPFKDNARPAQELHGRAIQYAPFDIRCPEGTRSNTKQKQLSDAIEGERKLRKLKEQQQQSNPGGTKEPVG